MKIDRLKILIALKEQRKNQKWLAEKLETDPSLISKWIRGIVNPGKNSLKKVSKVLNKSTSYFLVENIIRENIEPYSFTPLTGGNVVTLPLLADMPAGLPDYSNKDIESFTHIPRYLFPGANFIIQCIESSMEPEISKGTYCVIRKELHPLHNRIMLVKTEEGFTFKRTVRVKNKIELHPSNKKHKIVRPKELKVVGEVIGTWKRI